MIEVYRLCIKDAKKVVDDLKRKCHENSEETHMYKEELDSVADTLKDRDRRIELLEKEKVDIFLLQQQQQ